MRVTVDDVRLYCDVGGCGLAARGARVLVNGDAQARFRRSPRFLSSAASFPAPLPFQRPGETGS